MFIRFSLFGALTLLSASSALALTCANDYGSSAGCASNTTAAGDCATLGYSKDNVDGCEHYLYCPFDTSYKRCVASEKIDCSDYPFEECPEGANCSACGIGTDIFYKIDACKSGYTLSGNSCVAKSCDGYSSEYKSVADCGKSGSLGWTYSTCLSGDTLLGKCTEKSCGGPHVSHWGDDTTAEEKCLALPNVESCASCYMGDIMFARITACKNGYDNQNGKQCLYCNGPFSATSGTEAYKKCMAVDHIKSCSSPCYNSTARKYFSNITACEEGYENHTSSCYKKATEEETTACTNYSQCPTPAGTESDGVASGTCTVTKKDGYVTNCKLKSCNGHKYAAISTLDLSAPGSGTDYDACGWRVTVIPAGVSGQTWSLSEQWVQYCCTGACRYTSTSNPPSIANLSHYVSSNCGVIQKGGSYFVYLK